MKELVPYDSDVASTSITKEVVESKVNVAENESVNQENQNKGDAVAAITADDTAIVKAEDSVNVVEDTNINYNESTRNNAVVKNIQNPNIISDAEITLTDEEKKVQSVIKNLVMKSHESVLSMIVTRIELGSALVDAKIKLKKRMLNVIDTEILSKKEINRAMKLVLKHDVDYRQAMSNDGGVVDIENNIKLLVKDERVTNLTVESLKLLNKPTLKKIQQIKLLSDDEYERVIRGEDKPLNDYLSKIRDDEKKERESEHNSKKPESMSQDEYNEVYKAGIYTAISAISDLKSEIKRLNEKISTLEQQIESKSSTSNVTELNLKSDSYSPVQESNVQHSIEAIAS